MLLISEYGLDCIRYNSVSDAKWENSEVRTWLNRVFLYDAFVDDEREYILETRVTADPNPDFDSDQGNDTWDRVFLLSAKEALQYFSTDSERQCYPTLYAKKKANYKDKSLDCCWWWLRTVGETEDKITLVTARQGDIEIDGDGVEFDAGTVRPAMWVRCTSGD